MLEGAAIFEKGPVIVADGNHPVVLDDESAVYLVLEGRVNLFGTRYLQGHTDKRRFLFHADAGEVLFGIKNTSSHDGIVLVAIGAIATKLVRVSLTDFLGERERFTSQIQMWLNHLTYAAQRYSVSLVAMPAETDLLSTESKSKLFEFNRAFLDQLQQLIKKSEDDESFRIQSHAKLEKQSFVDSLARLLLFFKQRRQIVPKVMPEESLGAACRILFDYLGLPFRLPEASARALAHEDAVFVIADTSGVRARQIRLNSDFWRHSYGPMLCIKKEGDQPVALVPKKNGRYLIYDVVSGQTKELTRANAEELRSDAYVFFRPLPTEKFSGLSLFRWMIEGYQRDGFKALLLGLGIGLLGLFLPALVGVLFDFIIPSASYEHLWFFGAVLLVVSASIALLKMTQTLFVARMSGQAVHVFQSALIDRVIQLPVQFFRYYSSSDLAFRVLGADAIRRVLSDAVILAFLSGIFSVFYLGLLFFYSVHLAFIACFVALVQICYVGVVYFFHIRALANEGRAAGESSRQVYEILNAIAKIRVAGAELRAFVLWSKNLFNHVAASLKVWRTTSAVSVFNLIFQYLSLAILFFAIASSAALDLTLGQFLAFNAALFLFGFSLISLSELTTVILEIVPAYRGLLPILKAIPEITSRKADVAQLTGHIEISHASFRYAQTSRQILFDTSLQVNPGQFVAIVGPSGAGKSTLLRLMLGFENPTSGAVYFDGQDLSTLNIQQVRKQLGVVLQNGKLFPGSILDNIVGSTLLTIDDAWAAAKMCGLDEDINAMPMGMQTVIGENGGVSGGQRQRILIARALVKKPKVLFFDEATSALDNNTQKIVSDSIATLNVTRVVIAHRLSTIRSADQIYVLDHGRMMQAGRYDELLSQPGLFAELAKRQLG